MTEFAQAAFSLFCSVALGTSAPSEVVLPSPSDLLQPVSQQLSAPEPTPVTSNWAPAMAAMFAPENVPPEVLEEMKEEPAAPALPAPKLDAAPNFPGASEVFAYSDTAYQTLPPRPVKVKGKQVDLSECIAESARKEGIDPLLVEIVIKHESAFDPQACSGVGASGLMQLMPETARELGVTDLNDPEQNIAAGTKYLAQQYRHYANLHLALAAYNAGPGNVDYYGGVPPFDETQNYASSIASEYEERRMLR